MRNVIDAPRRSLVDVALDPLPAQPLDAEAHFYARYDWCLNARPRLAGVVDHLRDELRRDVAGDEDWQRAERRINVFLLSCAITDALDDFLLGTQYDFSQATAVVPLLGRAVRAIEALSSAARGLRRRRLAGVRRWRETWKAGVNAYLRELEAAERSDDRPACDAGAGLLALLDTPLPSDVLQRRIRIPAAFRTQDLTHGDVFALARTLAEAYPDRNRPIAIVGLRTAGSYFAPLIHAWLVNAGYRDVDWITIRPTRAMGPPEHAALAGVADRDGLAVVVDEAPNTGSTLAKAVGLVRATGFARDRVVVLVPIHPTRRDWAGGADGPLADTRTLTLSPSDWRKHQWLDVAQVQARADEYFRARGYVSATVAVSGSAQTFNRHLRSGSDEKFHTRLKRVYEVRLCDRSGRSECRFLIAKSVGWGWLGYHAFLAASRLAGFVPPVLGLRDGILYSEWLPSCGSVEQIDRDELIARLASYTAARVRCLPLDTDLANDVERGDQHKGLTLLAAALSKASGWKPATILQRARLRYELARTPAPHAVLIDGKMRPQEWVVAGGSCLKTDFEHHGLGKTELNITDPAYDLAESILHFKLSPAEERALVRQYAEQCGDTQVASRLFLHKLLAGTWARSCAVDNLGDAALVHRHQECHEQHLNAGNFLTVHTMQHCAGLSHRPQAIRWGSPIVVLDIDGVLDKQIFGFPSTTAAGIEAVSLLHAHGVPVAVNTARSLREVQEYCDAYGFVGGVAEYGGAVWDAVARRERRLVSGEALAQLDRLSAALQQLPGVFLDNAYSSGIRAYTFERGVTVPLPTLQVRNLMAGLGADQLKFHQTFVDTTVIPRGIDKGQGLLALLAMAGHSAADTVTIGDSEADLSMFRVAGRAFAPSHISCRSAARLVGCQIMDRPFQPGLLRAVRAIVHPPGETCAHCAVANPSRLIDRSLFGTLLAAADQPRWRLMVKALLDPMSVQTVRQALMTTDFAAGAPVILDFGCGLNKAPGSIGIDRAPLPGVDLVHDLASVPYPLPDDWADEIRLTHVLEHFADPLPILQEAWRIARAGAIVVIRTPHYSGIYSWKDPTHRRAFSAESFHYFGENAYSYYTVARFRVVNVRLKYYLEDRFWPWPHRVFGRVVQHVLDRHPTFAERFLTGWIGGIDEIQATLEVVKPTPP